MSTSKDERRQSRRPLNSTTIRSLQFETLEERRLLAVFAVSNLLDNGPGSLRQAIISANQAFGPDEIRFNAGLDGTISLLTGELAITDSLSIDGGGRITIDAQEASRVLRIDDGVTALSNVSLTGLTITRGLVDVVGSIDLGGAILNSENLSLTGCTISNSTAEQGGGIFHKSGLLTVTSSFVTGNFSTDRDIPGPSAQYGGGGIVSLANASIVGSTITGNRASFGGGIVNAGTMTVSGSFVTRNDAYLPSVRARAGGIESLAGAAGPASLTITNSVISDNHMAGVATTNGTLEVTKSSILRNGARLNGIGAIPTAAHNGGGVSAVGSQVTLTESDISFNQSVGSPEFTLGRGGGIYARNCDLVVDACTVAHNSAAYVSQPDGFAEGGGIYGELGTVMISASTISDNVADNEGGAAYFVATTVTLRQTTVSSNTSRGNSGGLVASFNTTLDVEYSTITNNSGYAVLSQNSGGLVKAWSSIIAGNERNIALANGGQFNSQGYNVIGDSVGFTPAVGDQTGVADPLLGPLTYNGGTTRTHAPLAGSSAVGMGPILALDLPANDQRGSAYARTFAGRVDVGAVERQNLGASQAIVVDSVGDDLDGDVSSGKLSLREALGISNGNQGFDDAITFAVALSGKTIELAPEHGELKVVESVSIDGTALAQPVTVSGTAANTLLSQGTARFGLTKDFVRLLEVDDEIEGNVLTVSLANLRLVGGVANLSGGGIRNRENLLLISSEVSGNTTEVTGGGIDSYGGNLYLYDSAVSDNIAGTSGGGVFFQNGNVTVSRTTIAGNLALGDAIGGNGGGLFVTLANLTITDSTISGNSATKGGGGLAALNFTALGQQTRISQSTISGNSAMTGGGLYNQGGKVDAYYSTVTNNDATLGAGLASRGAAGTRTELRSTILAGNQGNDFDRVTGPVESIFSSGYNVVGFGHSPLVFAALGDVNGIASPQLASLSDNGGPTRTHLPLNGSIVIDHGDPIAAAGVGNVPQFDQRDTPFGRVFDGRIDVGAVEWQPPLTTFGDFDVDGDVDGNDFLRWQRGLGAIYDHEDLTEWRNNFGSVALNLTDREIDVASPSATTTVISTHDVLNVAIAAHLLAQSGAAAEDLNPRTMAIRAAANRFAETTARQNCPKVLWSFTSNAAPHVAIDEAISQFGQEVGEQVDRESLTLDLPDALAVRR